MMVGRRPRMVRGATVASAGVMASAHGLFEDSSGAATLFPLLLSLLLSRMLFGSPFTAWCLVKPDELEPEFDSTFAVLELTLEVSIWRPLFGDFALLMSSSTQPAGVGGIGPNEEDPCPIETDI